MDIVNLLRQAIADSDPAAPKADWTKIDTEVGYEGKKITLPMDPAKMPIDNAIKTLERVKEQENQKFDVRETVPGAPWDALVAVYKAMQDIYGVVMATSIKTFFGEIRPDFVTVNTGHGPHDRIQVPSGQMTLPGVNEPVFVQMNSQGVMIAGTVRKADRAILVEIANRAREIIRSNSIYRGKALKFKVSEDGDLQLSEQPEFLDLSNVTEGDMIHPKDVEAQIQTSIFAPLKHTAACRKNRVPLKRGILLSGKYGTGKSLTCRVTAKVAEDNGWTFIMLNRAQGLRAALDFAKQYAPCVVFAEDIDRAADREDESVNDLVNMMDGVLTKNSEVMVVLTTNFIDKIDKALLRPGRFDAVITLEAPDGATAQKIMRSYLGDLIGVDDDLMRAGELVAGMIPASIREVVERSKLSMLVTGGTVVTPHDLEVAALGMRAHMQLLDAPPTKRSAGDRLGDLLVEIMGGGDVSLDTFIEGRDAILSHVTAYGQAAVRETKGLSKYAAAAADSSAKARDASVATYTEVKKLTS